MKQALVAILAATTFASLAQADDKPQGERYALLVGVRQYDRSELESLPFTEADIRDLALVLKDSGYDHVVLMTQTVGADDTRYLPLAANIRKEMKLLLQDLKEHDSLVVALAGHGVQFRESEEVYFCPADAKVADKDSLIPFSEIYKQLEECGAGFKLLLVDACRNDPQANVTRRATVALESVTRPQKKLPPGGVAALFSCSSSEFAYESKKLKHGVFFHFVIEGLKGGADLDGDKKVTLPELELFTKKKVPAYVREEFGNRQMPDLIGKTRGLLPLTTIETAESLYQQGKELVDQGEYQRAVNRLDASLRREPNNAWALFYRGMAHAELENYDEAIADYTACLKIDPEDVASYNNRGLAYYHKDEYELAIADYTKALELKPGTVLYLRNRGNAHYAAGDQEKALADYGAALQADPNDVDTLLQRAELFRGAKELRKAVADCNRAIEIKKDYALAFTNRGHAFNDMGERDKAIADYTESLRLEQDNVEVLYHRAWLYHAQIDYQRALNDFNAVLRLDGEHLDAAHGKAVCLARLGKKEESLRVAQDALKQSEDDAHSHATLSEVLYLAGKDAEAVEAIDRAVAAFRRLADPTEQQVTNQRNYRLFKAWVLAEGKEKNVDAALKIVREVLQEDAEFVEALKVLGYILAEHHRDLDEAERVLSKAIELDRAREARAVGKVDPEHFAGLALVKLRQNQPAEARKLLLQVIDQPSLLIVTFYDVLGDVHLALGEKAEAVKAWKKALEVALPNAADQLRKARVEEKLKASNG